MFKEKGRVRKRATPHITFKATNVCKYKIPPSLPTSRLFTTNAPCKLSRKGVDYFVTLNSSPKHSQCLHAHIGPHQRKRFARHRMCLPSSTPSQAIRMGWESGRRTHQSSCVPHFQRTVENSKSSFELGMGCWGTKERGTSAHVHCRRRNYVFQMFQ
jgi:hypothetical protein